MLEALQGTNKIELICIFLGKARQNANLKWNTYIIAHVNKQNKNKQIFN